MRSPDEPGTFAFPEGARTPYTYRVRPRREDRTEGGEAWPTVVRSPRIGVNKAGVNKAGVNGLNEGSRTGR